MRFRSSIRFMMFLIIFLPWAIAFIVSMPSVIIRKKIDLANGRKPRIIHGPIPIIAIKHLAEAEKLYGYKSDTLVYEVYHINQKSDFDFVFKFNEYNPIRLLVPYFVFIWVIWNYDIFQFFFDGGFLASTPFKKIELPLLKLLGKKILVCPYGSDAHIPSMTKSEYDVINSIINAGYMVDERKVYSNIIYFSKFADYVIATNSCVDSMTRWDSVFHYAPIDVAKWTPVYSSGNEFKVKIVHATNHRSLSGTQHLIDACKLLEQEGYQIELIIVEKKPNYKAKKIYQSADIVVDHLRDGGYGLFAIETMALGKPVLANLREDLIGMHKSWAEIPCVRINPTNIKETLVKLIEDPALRVEFGKRSRAFIEKYHSYQYIGSIFDKIYRKLWFSEDVEIDL